MPFSPGAAMLNRRLFITGANGRLFERYWNGKAWVWLEEVHDAIAKPELTRIEAALCYQRGLDGRPHLGKHHTLNRARLERLFPKFDACLAAYKRFNAFGTFDSVFTDQLVLTGVH